MEDTVQNEVVPCCKCNSKSMLEFQAEKLRL